MQALPQVQKLFAPSKVSTETISPILKGTSFTLEHIVSNAAASESDFWYDQENPEWVTLIKGSATIKFETGSINLTAGDALLIEAHSKHQITSTSKDAAWLALHFQSVVKD